MLDGLSLVDVHLHAARLPPLKPAWRTWADDFGGASIIERVYDPDGIFGTDWPGVPGIAANARAVAAECPDPETAALVHGGNATRVYRLKLDSSP